LEIKKEYIVCQECGKQFKSLNIQHLRLHNMTLKEYKKKYPNYSTISELRSYQCREHCINNSLGNYIMTKEHKQKISESMKGKKFSKEHRKNLSNAHLGSGSGKLRCQVYYRRLIEKQIGRKLKSNEVIHHKDHNPLNNKLNNLQLMTDKEHKLFHTKKNFKNKKIPCQKLSKDDCLYIIKNLQIPVKKLAKKFNITRFYVYALRWKFKNNKLIWQK